MPGEEALSSNPSQEKEYEQVSMSIRHYSNLRFLIIPIFFGINAAMFIAIQGDKGSITPPMYFVVLAFFFLVFGVFVFLECILNRYLEAFVTAALKISPYGFWQSRPRTGNWVSWSIRVLYFFVVLFWLALAVLKNFAPG